MRTLQVALALTGATVLACAPYYLDRNRPPAAREVEDPAPALRIDARPSLLLTEWRCTRGDDWIAVEGEVRNIGHRMLANVTAVGVFQAGNKDLVKSDRALLRNATLLPGQTSAFEVRTADEPAIASCALDFGHLMGGAIRFAEALDPADIGPEQVRALQLELIDLGYNPGRPDGLVGPRTRDAIFAFQEDHDLRPDGLISAELLALLGAGG